jgi:hypothetical protein
MCEWKDVYYECKIKEGVPVVACDVRIYFNPFSEEDLMDYIPVFIMDGTRERNDEVFPGFAKRFRYDRMETEDFLGPC